MKRRSHSHVDASPTLEVSTVASARLELANRVAVRDPRWLELVALALKTAAVGTTIIAIAFAAVRVL